MVCRHMSSGVSGRAPTGHDTPLCAITSRKGEGAHVRGLAWALAGALLVVAIGCGTGSGS